MPNLVVILADGAVAGERTGSGNIEQILSGKRFFILCVIAIGLQARVTVGQKVQKQEVVIRIMPACSLEQSVVKLAEHAAAAVRKSAVYQGIDNTTDPRFLFIQLFGIIHAALRFDFLDRRAKDVVVFPSGPLHNLDVRPVKRAQRYGAVEHKFHIACAAGLRTGSGDLLRDVGCRDQLFGVRYVVILHEKHLHEAVYIGIIIDLFGDFVDELNDSLGAVVAGRRLRSKEEGRWEEVAEFPFL